MKSSPILLSLILLLAVPSLYAKDEVSKAGKRQAEATEETAPEAKLAAWQEEFNALDEEVRKEYISKFQVAEALFQQKRIIECLRVTEDLEKLYAGNPGLYNLRGACYIEIRDIDKAIVCFKKALEISPENSTFEFNLAECYFVSHDYKTAATQFKTILDKLPKDTNKFIKSLLDFKLYICYTKNGDKEKIAEQEQLYGLLDDLPYYYCVLSVKEFEAGNKEEGNKNYLSAAAIFHDTPMLQPYIDAMQEAGYIISVAGQTVGK